MPHNVAYFLSEQAKLHPNAAAVRAPVGRASGGAIRYVERSFAELDAEASATAYYFTDKGIQRGTRVLLMVKPGLDLIRIVFALFLALCAAFKAHRGGRHTGCDMGGAFVSPQFSRRVAQGLGWDWI